MAKVRIGAWEVDENELDRQHEAALRRGAQQAALEPHARSAHYDAEAHALIIELTNGVTVSTPIHLLQGLEGAPAERLAAVVLGPRGASLHWEELGVDFSVAGLLTGVFGTRAWMAEAGRRGGRATSEAKAAAARANGAKGGRPKKTVQVTAPR
ncbi:MAG: DUF2442 domain-containing protein [Caldilinea sp.]